MSVRAHRMVMLSLCCASLVALAGSGCCPRCGSECAPLSLWQSPTIQATRAFLVVNTQELKILRIDGRNVRPSCVGEGGVREYHLPAGTHAITAVFRYVGRVGGGLTGTVEGAPITVEQQFIAGHEYVPVYREHAQQPTECEYLLEVIAAAARPKRNWSLDIVDLATTQHSMEPEVQEARLYCNVVRGVAATPPSPFLY